MNKEAYLTIQKWNLDKCTAHFEVEMIIYDPVLTLVDLGRKDNLLGNNNS